LYCEFIVYAKYFVDQVVGASVRDKALPPIFDKLRAGSVFDRIKHLNEIAFEKFQKAGRVGIAQVFNVFIARERLKL
jgi:hypothetical protein